MERVARLRRTAKALEIPWPDDVTYADLVRDARSSGGRCTPPSSPSRPSSSAARAIWRSTEKSPAKAVHAGVASTYAHTTAPLRRLVDRYVGEVCVAISGGGAVPDWARSMLPSLPETMDVSNRRAQQYESGIVSTVEAAVLERSIGDTFQAVVVDVDEHDGGGTVQLKEPAVTARCEGDDLPLGEPRRRHSRGRRRHEAPRPVRPRTVVVVRRELYVRAA